LRLNRGHIAMPFSQSASSFAMIIVKARQGGFLQVDKRPKRQETCSGFRSRSLQTGRAG